MQINSIRNHQNSNQQRPSFNAVVVPYKLPPSAHNTRALVSKALETGNYAKGIINKQEVGVILARSGSALESAVKDIASHEMDGVEIISGLKARAAMNKVQTRKFPITRDMTLINK